MNFIPSIRQMRLLFKELLVHSGFDRRALILARESFYAGARWVFSALAFQADRGRFEEIGRAITRQGRQNKALMGSHRESGGTDGCERRQRVLACP